MISKIKSAAKVIVLTLFITAANGLFAQTAETGKKYVDIKTSAVCGHCKKAIETAVTSVDGVKSATVDLDTKIVTVKYDVEKTNVDALKTAIVNIGYDADEIPADVKAYDNLSPCCKKE